MVDTRDDFCMQSMKIDPAIKKIYEKHLKIRRECISRKVEEYDDDIFYDYNYFWNKQCISCDQFGLQQSWDIHLISIISHICLLWCY